jgi:hypothetical protein
MAAPTKPSRRAGLALRTIPARPRRQTATRPGPRPPPGRWAQRAQTRRPAKGPPCSHSRPRPARPEAAGAGPSPTGASGARCRGTRSLPHGPRAKRADLDARTNPHQRVEDPPTRAAAARIGVSTPLKCRSFHDQPPARLHPQRWLAAPLSSAPGGGAALSEPGERPAAVVSPSSRRAAREKTASGPWPER